MKRLKYAHSFEITNELPELLKPLEQLSKNYYWSWHYDVQELFGSIDPIIWKRVNHNPVALINSLGQEKINQLEKDQFFLSALEDCKKRFDLYIQSETWFDTTYAEKKNKMKIAYFCAEFGITECLPIYSGGLGILAGDHLKAASDLGLPLVGVGLLYSRGYFRQYLNPEGWQQEYYPQYDFFEFPLQLIRGADDQPLRVSIEFPDRTIICQIWRADIGRISLYLLDSNVLENEAKDQSITDTLYGGDEEMRIRQEIVLGIGGMKALQALGIHPTVCHMNEGHSAFLSLERIRQCMEEYKCDFHVARQAIVAGNAFTTHTPVPAGFDIFYPPLLEKYMAKTLENINLPFSEFLTWGRLEPDNDLQPFNMAVLAIKNANHLNAVSKLHAEVTKEMFQNHWEGFPESEVPINGITNGIHTMTWMGKPMINLLDRYLGKGWHENPSEHSLFSKIQSIPNGELWDVKMQMRNNFIKFCRGRLRQTQVEHSISNFEHKDLNNFLDPQLLTIGFARRFATYKRATLLFSNKERLKTILSRSKKPIQLIFAGKSHPKDDGGKHLIQDIVRFINEEKEKIRVLFIEDYDIEVAKSLIQGVDVWLNTPRRPYEASGTSGMKAVVNGVLHCSILDGWWAEAYKPDHGWAIGSKHEHSDPGYQDWLDSLSLYHLLEHEIVPLYYQQDNDGVPQAWVETMKRSMMEYLPYFSTARMVKEYTQQHYIPASNAYLDITKDGLAEAYKAYEWRNLVQENWSSVDIVHVEDNTKINNEKGKEAVIKAKIQLGNLTPEDVSVEAIIGKVGANRELIETKILPFTYYDKQDGYYLYEGKIKCKVSGHRGYILRLVPKNKFIEVKMELPLVKWQKIRC